MKPQIIAEDVFRNVQMIESRIETYSDALAMLTHLQALIAEEIAVTKENVRLEEGGKPSGA